MFSVYVQSTCKEFRVTITRSDFGVNWYAHKCTDELISVIRPNWVMGIQDKLKLYPNISSAEMISTTAYTAVQMRCVIKKRIIIFRTLFLYSFRCGLNEYPAALLPLSIIQNRKKKKNFRTKVEWIVIRSPKPP